MRESKAKHVLHLQRFLARSGGFLTGKTDETTLAQLSMEDYCPSQTHRYRSCNSEGFPSTQVSPGQTFSDGRLAVDYTFRYLRVAATKIHQAAALAWRMCLHRSTTCAIFVP